MSFHFVNLIDFQHVFSAVVDGLHETAVDIFPLMSLWKNLLHVLGTKNVIVSLKNSEKHASFFVMADNVI